MAFQGEERRQSLELSDLGAEYDGDSIPLVATEVEEVTATVATLDVNNTLAQVCMSWVLELVCSVLAIFCLVAMFFLLERYDQKNLDEWHFPISLSALLSIITLVIRTALAVPVTIGLAQLKWSYCYHGSDMTRFIAIHSASTSVLSSATLLTKIAPWWVIWHMQLFCHQLCSSYINRSFAAIAAILAVSSSGLGPIIQQSLELRLRQVNSTTMEATMPVFIDLSFPDDFGFLSSTTGVVPVKKKNAYSASDRMLQSIYTGIYSTTSTNTSQISVAPVCPTGNCTFKNFHSLAICSTCANVTSQLSIRWDKNGTVVLPSDYGLCNAGKFNTCRTQLPNKFYTYTSFKVPTIINVTTSADIVDPKLLELSGFLNLTAIIGKIHNDTYAIQDYQAVQCSLQFCPRKYNTSVTNGLVSQNFESIQKSPAINLPAASQECNRKKFATIPLISCPPPFNPGNCTYVIPSCTILGITRMIGGLLTGFAYEIDDVMTLSSHTMRILVRYGSEAVLESLALAMTQHILTKLSNDTFVGIVHEMKSYYHVNWVLLIFPGIITISTFILLIVLIITTKHQHIWKDSSLAVIYAGQHLNLQGPEMKRMQQSVRNLSVKLDGDGTLRRS